MDKEKLIKFLQDNDRYDLAVDLMDYNDRATDEWVNSNKDYLKAVPGYIDFAQPKEIKAPHGMTTEQAKRYFSNEDLDLDEKAYKDYLESEKQYEKEIAKKSELAKKAKLADEYTLNHSVKGYFYGNDFAKKAYAEGRPTAAKIHEAAGKIAAATDFIPGIGGLIGPTIRTAQKVVEDQPVLTGETALDYGLGALGLGKKAIQLYPVVKSGFGKAGEIAEKAKLLKNADKAAASYAAEAGRAATAKMRSDAYKDLKNIEKAGGFKNNAEMMDYLDKYPEMKDEVYKTVTGGKGSADILAKKNEVTVSPYGTKKFKELDPKISKKDYDINVNRELSKKGAKTAAALGMLGLGGVRNLPARAGTKDWLNETNQTNTKAIEWVKHDLSRQWEAGFKPKEDPNDIRWIAYQEWLKEKNSED